MEILNDNPRIVHFRLIYIYIYFFFSSLGNEEPFQFFQFSEKVNEFILYVLR